MSNIRVIHIRAIHILIAAMIVIGGFAILPESASACSCAMNPSVEESLQNSDAVFEGTVVGMNKPMKLFGQSSATPVTWVFQVNEVWKGKVAPTLSVTSAQSSASCGFEFKNGQRYLVYARDNGKSLDVSLCSRTALHGAAGGDLAELATLGTSAIPPAPPPASGGEAGAFWWIAGAVVLAAGAVAVVVATNKRKRLAASSEAVRSRK